MHERGNSSADLMFLVSRLWYLFLSSVLWFSLSVVSVSTPSLISGMTNGHWVVHYPSTIVAGVVKYMFPVMEQVRLLVWFCWFAGGGFSYLACRPFLNYNNYKVLLLLF